MNDIPPRPQRQIVQGTGYPEDERFTLQLIEILTGIERTLALEASYCGRDATFATGAIAGADAQDPKPKPSGLLLHYNYGAAVVKWWGHHTDILREDGGPPHPPPPPSSQRRRRQRRRPASGPSTLDIPSCLKPCSTTIHDRTISIRRREGHAGDAASGDFTSKQHSAGEPVNALKEWESWDEDEWMLYCMLNTKAARERRQAVEEASSYNIRAWAEEVSHSV